jgi:hypothetical protein
MTETKPLTPPEPILKAGVLALYDALFCTLKVRVTRVFCEPRYLGDKAVTVEFVVTSRGNIAYPPGTVERTSIHWLRMRNGAPFSLIETGVDA